MPLCLAQRGTYAPNVCRKLINFMRVSCHWYRHNCFDLMRNRTELSEPVKAIYPDLHLHENSSGCRQAVASWPPSITDIMAGLLVLYGTKCQPAEPMHVVFEEEQQVADSMTA